MAISKELQELYSDHKNTARYYEAITLSHSSFIGDVHLIMNDVNLSFMGIDFQAYPFGLVPPEVGSPNQDLSIVFDNISFELIQHLNLAYASNSNEPIKLVYYVFMENSLQSEITPIELSLSNVQVNQATITGVAKRADLFSYKFPMVKYDARFKGLFL